MCQNLKPIWFAPIGFLYAFAKASKILLRLDSEWKIGQEQLLKLTPARRWFSIFFFKRASEATWVRKFFKIRNKGLPVVRTERKISVKNKSRWRFCLLTWSTSQFAKKERIHFCSRKTVTTRYASSPWTCRFPSLFAGVTFQINLKPRIPKLVF